MGSPAKAVEIVIAEELGSLGPVNKYFFKIGRNTGSWTNNETGMKKCTGGPRFAVEMGVKIGKMTPLFLEAKSETCGRKPYTAGIMGNMEWAKGRHTHSYEANIHRSTQDMHAGLRFAAAVLVWGCIAMHLHTANQLIILIHPALCAGHASANILFIFHDDRITTLGRNVSCA